MTARLSVGLIDPNGKVKNEGFYYRQQLDPPCQRNGKRLSIAKSQTPGNLPSGDVGDFGFERMSSFVADGACRHRRCAS
jgi:hypothetical protein